MKTKKSMRPYPFLIMAIILILATSCEKKEDPSDTMTDRDGNVYTSVTIGTQTWMVENLKTTKYKDGTDIPLVTDDTEWANLNTPDYCWYNNDAATYKNPYGALYNWYAVSTGKLCPTGWHVPTHAEWVTLFNYLGNNIVAGGKLKEASTTHWNSPNVDATNESGFTGLPGGGRHEDGTFLFIGICGSWWSTTEDEYDSDYAWEMGLNYNLGQAFSVSFNPKKNGYSVRCLKD